MMKQLTLITRPKKKRKKMNTNQSRVVKILCVLENHLPTAVNSSSPHFYLTHKLRKTNMHQSVRKVSLELLNLNVSTCADEASVGAAQQSLAISISAADERAACTGSAVTY